MTMLDATWNGFDEKQSIQLNEQLNNLGSGGSIVRPEGTNINLLELQKNGDGKLQTGLIDLLNKEISKVILGSTETVESSDSSGYAQSQTHAQGVNKKNQSDIAFTRRVLNSRVRKILQDNGINIKGGRFISSPGEEKLSKKDAYTIHKSMVKKLSMQVDDDF